MGCWVWEREEHVGIWSRREEGSEGTKLGNVERKEREKRGKQRRRCMRGGKRVTGSD